MTASNGNGWLMTMRPKPGASVRLLCVPYAGGGPQMFNQWPDLLPDVEVVAVNLPGRGRRLIEPPFTSLVPLARAFARSLAPSCSKPFAFFGHSMGALIAYETARQLTLDYGIQPVHLFVSGAAAPHIAEPNPLHGLRDDEFFEEIRKLGGMPDEVLESEELIQLVLPTLRADFTLAETYKCLYDDPIACPISAFAGESDPLASFTDVEQWERHSLAKTTVRIYPGGHFFLNSFLPEITNRIAEQLNVHRWGKAHLPTGR